jgi:sugar-specific transcriptional regulator TrmB
MLLQRQLTPDMVGLEGVHVLIELGQTGRQARVYLALLKAGDAKVQTIAGPSGVNRQEIYRLLDSLLQRGLIQRHVSAPSLFRATPISEAIESLLEQKTREWTNIYQQAKQLTTKLNQTPPATVDVKPSFGTVFEGDRDKKYAQAIKETQHTIEITTSWKRFKQLSIHFETQLQRALKKDVSLQIVTEKPLNNPLPKWINTALAKNRNFKIVTQPILPTASIALFDRTTAAIAFNSNTSLTKGPTLWTINPSLTTLCHVYFNTVWTQTNAIA